MKTSSTLLFSLLWATSNAQITLTGCSVKNGQEVCLLPGGAETTIGPVEVPTPTSPPTVSATTTGAAQTTAITACHLHGPTQYCVKGNGEEVQVLATAASGVPLPTAYTGCHAHGQELWCMTPDGGEVQAIDEGAEGEADSHEGEEHVDEGDAGGENCHFHAGVEHCVGAGEGDGHGGGASGEAGVSGASGAAAARRCNRRDRDYNVKLRIGLLFVILITSAIAVYGPIVLTKMMKIDGDGIVFTIVKQFGTGIIIATALVHLNTHAELMFKNPCLGTLKYEATTTAIMMAGAWIAFVVDFTGHRIGHWRRTSVEKKQQSGEITQTESPPSESAKGVVLEPRTNNLSALSHHHDHGAVGHANDSLSVIILETGIIFHSLLLGITLVVAGDSVFITLFVVIVFHQMFEGLALGARIAAISGLPKTKYIVLPMAFAFVTPIGMAIGIGVLNTFNGNDPSTIVALGTLDALSAGILLWVGLVSMWANDWMYGSLRHAPLVKTIVAMIALMAGMALMGLLGKWA